MQLSTTFVSAEALWSKNRDKLELKIKQQTKPTKPCSYLTSGKLGSIFSIFKKSQVLWNS